MFMCFLFIVFKILLPEKKHININTFAGLCWDWVGAKIMFMFLFRAIPYGKQSPLQNPGQFREMFVYVFFTLCVFFFFFFFAA